ncbi:serine/threonine-protein kinase [Frankia tisae]|uniref:serine/threonine-protein kinase n=1 Tax=Frankia tisae TaxID=2950104 RepID=UPI0034D418A9
MGTVSLGRSSEGRPVAIKVVREEFVRDEEFRSRFRREVAAARRVARFCTAAVVDADLTADRPYLVTEFVAGPSLAAAIRRDGPLRPPECEQLAVSVATALIQIHAAGIIHRDLKPSNVLLSATGPKVIDFGIARAMDATSVISRDLRVLGTPAYMAPEQVEEEEPTSAIDIFAWAGVLVFAASGKPPFGEGPAALLPCRILHEHPRLDGIDARLRGLMEQAFAKDPSSRPTAHGPQRCWPTSSTAIEGRSRRATLPTPCSSRTGRRLPTARRRRPPGMTHPKAPAKVGAVMGPARPRVTRMTARRPGRRCLPTHSCPRCPRRRSRRRSLRPPGSRLPSCRPPARRPPP